MGISLFATYNKKNTFICCTYKINNEIDAKKFKIKYIFFFIQFPKCDFIWNVGNFFPDIITYVYTFLYWNNPTFHDFYRCNDYGWMKKSRKPKNVLCYFYFEYFSEHPWWIRYHMLIPTRINTVISFYNSTLFSTLLSIFVSSVF